MGVHQFNKNMPPDSEFVPGSIKYLVPGNKCRLLDGRRTPGVIEQFSPDSAIFRWRITDFEHKGRCWDIPAEDVIRYQFTKDSKGLSDSDIKLINKRVKSLGKKLKIEATRKNLEKTTLEINETKALIKSWMRSNSLFFKNQENLNFESKEGSKSLAQDLIKYMNSVGLDKLESRNAESIVLNPYSGEWIKGMRIVLAEMGLVGYEDKIPRTKDIFIGLGNKNIRRKYLIHRLAFIRAYFELLKLNEVVLYRGMSSERDW